MKILYFQEPKVNYVFGGVSNVAYHLSRALAKNALITYFPNFVPKRDYATKILNVYRRLAIGDFDVVHFNVTPTWAQGGDSLYMLAKMAQAATILIIHGIIQMEHRLYGTKQNEGLSMTLRYCKMANRIVTYSEFMRNRIVTWYRVNRDKIVVIPNGVDVDRFSEFKSELLLDGDPAILYLGHLSKSVDLLIETVSKIRLELPELKLHVVGGGDIATLKLLAIKKGVSTQVIFHGSVAPTETPKYYKAADICVFPSKIDSAGITLLEAMASGTAVIVSNRGGTPEIICHGENGVLFEPDNTDALPDAILGMHQDRELRKTVSRNALKTVRNYSWENIAKKYLSLYRSLREVRSNANFR
jgi:glycosyltransferase involved in cell wall biosynthesis